MVLGCLGRAGPGGPLTPGIRGSRIPGLGAMLAGGKSWKILIFMVFWDFRGLRCFALLFLGFLVSGTVP